MALLFIVEYLEVKVPKKYEQSFINGFTSIFVIVFHVSQFIVTVSLHSLFTALIFQEYKITSVGNYEVNDNIWRVLKCLFSNALGHDINCSGKNGKTPFCQLHLKKLIFGKSLISLAIC